MNRDVYKAGLPLSGIVLFFTGFVIPVPAFMKIPFSTWCFFWMEFFIAIIATYFSYLSWFGFLRYKNLQVFWLGTGFMATLLLFLPKMVDLFKRSTLYALHSTSWLARTWLLLCLLIAYGWPFHRKFSPRKSFLLFIGIFLFISGMIYLYREIVNNLVWFYIPDWFHMILSFLFIITGFFFRRRSVARTYVEKFFLAGIMLMGIGFLILCLKSVYAGPLVILSWQFLNLVAFIFMFLSLWSLSVSTKRSFYTNVGNGKRIFLGTIKFKRYFSCSK